MLIFNHPLAAELEITPEFGNSPEGTEILSGSRLPDQVQSIALAYSGHQFGHFVPLLGDGRAVLLGEIRAKNGVNYDLQLKGSGQTPFSRRGDGRAALGPMLREYIIGEALHHLGIPATRTLAVVASGEMVRRERTLPGGIQSRIAQSHVRIGSFQYAATRGDIGSIKALADYVIKRHYAELQDQPDRYFGLIQAIFERQARLVAQWMNVGFIHGVMNTDNVAVSGESIDFGPCAFMNSYDSETVFSSIDQDGRYAFGMQPIIIQWNLARLAEVFVPLLDSDEDKGIARAQGLVNHFRELYHDAWLGGMRRKIGIYNHEDSDEALITKLLDLMSAARLDFTGTFRALSGDALFTIPEQLRDWQIEWEERVAPTRNGRLRQETASAMLAYNPAVIARNHIVEAALREAVEQGNIAPVNQLVEALRSPYKADLRFMEPPTQEYDRSYRTFCGT